MKNRNRIVQLFIVTLLFFGCQTEEVVKDTVEENTTSIEDLQEVFVADTESYKEVALLLGKVMMDSEIRAEIDQKLNEVDSFGELASLSYLLGVEHGLMKNEIDVFALRSATSKSNENALLKAISSELQRNSSDYSNTLPSYERLYKGGIGSKSDILQELAVLLASKEMQIYLPYDDTIISGKTNSDDFYITFDPVVYVEENEAFKYVQTKTEKQDYTLQSIGMVDNDFLDNNPVYVIGPIDDCDIIGRTCDYVDLFPIGDEDDDTPPSYTGGPKLLTYNVNHSDIEEKDIISTRFSGFRFHDKDWLGFGATRQKFVLKRGSGSYAISSNGIITASLSAFDVGSKFRIRAKGVKKGWWYDVDHSFDDDWNMSENEQAFAIFTKHRFSTEASKELTIKGGIALKGGKATPVAEATSANKLVITVGGAKFRANMQLSRRQVLSTIVGKGLTNETRGDGTNWNSKNMGVFNFYLKHYYTNL